VLDRCLVWVTAPRAGADREAPPTAPEDAVRRWTDPDYIAQLNDFQHRTTFFGGEAFPMWHVSGFNMSLAAFIGCPVTLDRGTSGWVEPVLTERDWRLEDIHLDKNGRWYRFSVDLLKTAAEASEGRSIPCIPPLGGCGDTLAWIRGTERLLYDLVDRPRLVARTESLLTDMWIEVFDDFYSILSPSSEGGSVCYFPAWGPGKCYGVHNDFSYMISTETYEDIFLRALERQLKFLDCAIYHVDGVEAFRHVPLLCGLERLQALQILPGTGMPSPLHYMDVLRTVQAHGKGLHISIPPEEVETALGELSAKGLFIHTWCRTQADAEKIIADATKCSRVRGGH